MRIHVEKGVILDTFVYFVFWAYFGLIHSPDMAWNGIWGGRTADFTSIESSDASKYAELREKSGHFRPFLAILGISQFCPNFGPKKGQKSVKEWPERLPPKQKVAQRPKIRSYRVFGGQFLPKCKNPTYGVPRDLIMFLPFYLINLKI